MKIADLDEKTKGFIIEFVSDAVQFPGKLGSPAAMAVVDVLIDPHPPLPPSLSTGASRFPAPVPNAAHRGSLPMEAYTVPKSPGSVLVRPSYLSEIAFPSPLPCRFFFNPPQEHNQIVD